MPKNKIEDLRNHLFETLERLRDGEMDVKTAKAITEVAACIIESAKVEIEFVDKIGGIGSGFIPLEHPKGPHWKAKSSI